jgi:hypothetical protein
MTTLYHREVTQLCYEHHGIIQNLILQEKPADDPKLACGQDLSINQQTTLYYVL